MTVIREYIARHGISPTLGELCNATSIKSKGRMSELLSGLERRNLIIREAYAHRAITLSDRCVTCSRPNSMDEETLNILGKLDEAADFYDALLAKGKYETEIDVIGAAAFCKQVSSLIRQFTGTIK